MDDLSYANTIKHSLALEEEERGIDDINLSRNTPEENSDEAQGRNQEMGQPMRVQTVRGQ